MIKTLILFFLNIKPTHGYEIQKFIGLNCMDQWTKIQSGSIYYALSKLEQQNHIEILREEESKGKIKKIYQITKTGRELLEKELLIEIRKPIYDVGSDKFVSYPFLMEIEKDKIILEARAHVKELREKYYWMMQWQERKCNEDSLKILKLSFEMMLSSLSYQIKWHEALIEEIDRCIDESKTVSQMIKEVDFSEIQEMEPSKEQLEIRDLKEAMFSNPNNAEAMLNAFINKLKK